MSYKPLSSVSGKITHVLIVESSHKKMKEEDIVYKYAKIIEGLKDKIIHLLVLPFDKSKASGFVHWSNLGDFSESLSEINESDKLSPEVEKLVGMLAEINPKDNQATIINKLQRLWNGVEKVMIHRTIDVENIVNSVVRQFVEVVPCKFFGITGKLKVDISKQDLTQWAQDPFIVLSDDATGCTQFLESLYSASFLDQYVADEYSLHTDVSTKPTKFFLQGGNTLSDETFSLIGPSSLLRNSQEDFCKGMSLSEITNKLQETLGVERVGWPGFPVNCTDKEKIPKQPFFHLDLYLTLGGRTADCKYLVFLAEIETPKGQPYTGSEINLLDEVNRWFNDRKLHGFDFDFEVQRIPIGVVLNSDNNIDEFYSFNNVLIEKSQSCPNNSGRCFIPNYGPLDPTSNSPGSFTMVNSQFLYYMAKKAAEVYKIAGFDPVFIPGMNKFNLGMGSLHCVVKEIKRS